MDFWDTLYNSLFQDANDSEKSTLTLESPETNIFSRFKKEFIKNGDSFAATDIQKCFRIVLIVY